VQDRDLLVQSRTPHESAAASSALEQALADDVEDGLADRRERDAEHLREFPLGGELLAWS
jgi:hypothetical protein